MKLVTKKNKTIATILGLLAIVFGVLTIKSGSFALFGGVAGRQFAGKYVSFVLWFNFIAGFLYVITGVGVTLRKRWSYSFSGILASSTLFVFTAFGILISTGIDFEMRTVGAMFVRSSFWIGIFLYLKRFNKEV